MATIKNQITHIQDFDQKLQQAIVQHKAGDLQGAEQRYRALLESAPGHPVANHNLGIIALDANHVNTGLAYLKTALETDPDNAQYWVSFIDALIRTGAHEAARQLLMQGCQRGLTGDAVDYLKRQLTLTPPSVPGRDGSMPDAIPTNATRFLHQEDSRKFPEIPLVNRVIALFNQKQYAEAETLASEITTRFPEHGFGWKALGAILKQQGRVKESMAPMQQAARLLPEDAEVHNNLGMAFFDQGHLIEAEFHCRHALFLKPDYAEAHSHLGIILGDLGRLQEAETSYRRALSIKPDYAEAYNNLGNILKKLSRLEEAEACYRCALTIQPNYIEAHSNLLFSLNYTARHHLASHFEEARKYGKRIAQHIDSRFFDWCCAFQPKRLRVGFVSGDFRNHPVGYFIEAIIHELALSRIELMAYVTGHMEDELTERIKPCFAAWRSLVGKNDKFAAQLIHADGVHLLIDLAGHTALNRLPVFAWKPAPIQLSWLGYFATTGVQEMDYLLADPTGVPEAHSGQFTESVWYLPETRLCFSAPRFDIAVSSLPALHNGYLTFGCFQNLTKIGDEVLRLWGKIFAAIPCARLRLQCKQLSDPTVAECFRQRLIQFGIASERIILHGGVSREVYLRAHADIDLILDTFPYPGGTTTCEALWMGVPTLTLAGDRMLSRQGASLLRAAGLDDWIAETEEEYVGKAVSLANNLEKLSALRKHLRPQILLSPLFDAPRFARHFERALWAIWNKWQLNHGAIIESVETQTR